NDGIASEQKRTDRLNGQKHDAARQAMEAGQFPDLRGWSAPDAIAWLEEHGYKVQVKGHGRVQAAIRNEKTIELKLG
ncbi:MAG TPA: hypothetical protein DCE13_00705, partial [Cryomorphaceae bacterium]|nr:hypothetical protein [Cryomorphaceae bacterium]